MDTLKNYISSHPRNKLVVSNEMLDDFQYVDIGYELSLIISRLKNFTPIAVYDSLIRLIDSNIHDSLAYGRYVAISNIGILFESQLELNVRSIIDSISKNYLLVIHTEGEVDNSGVYFLTKTKGIKVDMSGMSYLKLDK